MALAIKQYLHSTGCSKSINSAMAGKLYHVHITAQAVQQYYYQYSSVCQYCQRYLTHHGCQV